MNRLKRLFSKKKKNILSIFFTAGFPKKRDTLVILKALEKTGKVDLVEIGFPFSDPVADGVVIQNSNQVAIQNGMTLSFLLDELKSLRDITQIPVVLMGYLNPVLQFGMSRFCREIKKIGVDGVILPDLPLEEYITSYESFYKEHELENIFLISPQTSFERVKKLDTMTGGFLYMVSTSSTTGEQKSFSEDTLNYFTKIQAMALQSPRLIGFGISNGDMFQQASMYASGAIIGSAFLRSLANSTNLQEDIQTFISTIKI